MAAETIANDLHLNLFRIDFSAVVRNISTRPKRTCTTSSTQPRMAVLISSFDEADALFGKRSKNKDSHDRYANIEVNYLFQRMESNKGLVIWATALKSTLDSQFFLCTLAKLHGVLWCCLSPWPGCGRNSRVYCGGHGERDQNLTADCSRQIYQWAKEPKELVIYPNNGHFLRESHDELHNLLKDWLVDRLKHKKAKT